MPGVTYITNSVGNVSGEKNSIRYIEYILLMCYPVS